MPNRPFGTYVLHTSSGTMMCHDPDEVLQMLYVTMVSQSNAVGTRPLDVIEEHLQGSYQVQCHSCPYKLYSGQCSYITVMGILCGRLFIGQPAECNSSGIDLLFHRHKCRIGPCLKPEEELGVMKCFAFSTPKRSNWSRAHDRTSGLRLPDIPGREP